MGADVVDRLIGGQQLDRAVDAVRHRVSQILGLASRPLAGDGAVIIVPADVNQWRPDLRSGRNACSALRALKWRIASLT
jgi:hypothetical protein